MDTIRTRRSVLRVAVSATLMLALEGLPRDVAAQQTLRWTSLEEAQARAAAEDRVVFVFVEAGWCTLCKRMKREVFPHAGVRRLMAERFVAVAIDRESRAPVTFEGGTITERSFARTMRVAATPTMIFIDAEGAVMGRYPGFVPADRLYALLRYVTSDVFGDVSFDAFVGASAPR